MVVPRRLLAVAALLAALCAGVLAACGGSDSKTAAGPRAEVLSYFPDKAGLVALVSTDVAHGQIAQARKLADRFPGSGIAIAQLRSQLLKGGLDYERDVKPLLGNEVAVGAARPGGLESNGVLLVAGRQGRGQALRRHRPPGEGRQAEGRRRATPAPSSTPPGPAPSSPAAAPRCWWPTAPPS